MRVFHALVGACLLALSPISKGSAPEPTPTIVEGPTPKEIATGLVEDLADDVCDEDSLDLSDSILEDPIRFLRTLDKEKSVVAQLRVKRNANGDPVTFTSGGKTFKKYRLYFSRAGFNRWREAKLPTAGGKWSELSLAQQKAALTVPIIHELIHGG